MSSGPTVNCSKSKVVETNYVNCSKNMVNCSKSKAVEANCSKNMVNCSKRKVVETNCSNSMSMYVFINEYTAECKLY